VPQEKPADMSQNPDLIEQIRALRPWHQNIRISESLQVMDAFDEQERQRVNNENVSMIDSGKRFGYKVRLIYPDGLAGKRFLDCACNAGGYCFWARDLGAESVFGFDVREHWIRQAEFVRQNRTIGPVDKMSFRVCDLLELGKLGIEPADFTLFKGIFYHLADPILGLKIAAEMTREVIWFNSARCFIDNTESLYCVFEASEKLMSGVHDLSWIPSGPSVIAKMLYWLGFTDIYHVFSKEYPDRPGFGRMEMMASRIPGQLDLFAETEKAERIDVALYTNSKQAASDVRGLF
jgi:SAM-dependent methyltransferase